MFIRASSTFPLPLIIQRGLIFIVELFSQTDAAERLTFVVHYAPAVLHNQNFIFLLNKFISRKNCLSLTTRIIVNSTNKAPTDAAYRQVYTEISAKISFPIAGLQVCSTTNNSNFMIESRGLGAGAENYLFRVNCRIKLFFSRGNRFRLTEIFSRQSNLQTCNNISSRKTLVGWNNSVRYFIRALSVRFAIFRRVCSKFVTR